MSAAAAKVESMWQANKDQMLKQRREREEAPVHMFKSPLRDIFQAMGRRTEEGTPFVVDCGPMPANAR